MKWPRVRQVPVVQPDQWEKFPVFRETFLSVLADPEDIKSFRVLGRQLFSGALTGGKVWPGSSMTDTTADELQAVLADLR